MTFLITKENNKGGGQIGCDAESRDTKQIFPQPQLGQFEGVYYTYIYLVVLGRLRTEEDLNGQRGNTHVC